MITLVLVALAFIVAGVPARPGRHRVDRQVTPAPSRLGALVATHAAQRRRQPPPSARAVAAWCDDIARCVRSGSSLRDAVAVAPPDAAIERATAPVRLAIDRGLSVTDAVARASHTGPHLRLALGVIATANRVGGPSSASIDRTAVLLRQRAGDLDDRSTNAAQARLSTHVMTAVPLVMLGVLVATDDDVRTAATSPIGAGCLAAGLVLNLAGWWWMHRIVETPS